MQAIAVRLLIQLLYYCKSYCFFKSLCFLHYEDITGRNYHFIITIVVIIIIAAVIDTISSKIITASKQNHIHFPCLEDDLSRTYQFY